MSIGQLEPASSRTPAASAPGTSRPTASISVVIPTLNEALNLPWVLRRMPSYVDEVIIVDGRSEDLTVDVARALRFDVVVVNELHAGKGAAMRAGFAAATGDIIVMLDADGSMDPREIGWFVSPLQHDHDFVKGSRYVTGGGSDDLTRLRNLGNRALTGLANKALHCNFSDLCYGYIAFRRECLEVLELKSDGFEIETELVSRAARAGLRIAEVPSHELSRISGNSHLQTFRDGWRVLRTLTRECVGWDAPTAGVRPEALRRVKYRYPDMRFPHVPTDPSTVLAMLGDGQ
ncbi:glycosyltransferase family 2 protein [Arthrobacter bambusae]|uniref:glycosyltransferase family 2 protein n=1 Tax=Arthrobacter bambusae TaxID=1338426 RepID=UPI00277EDE43|nr:glycosyltransferase family 2 protein [Arthrobacter bambusae]MDQ0031207.1 glycosyltransferase involved in cell wall biosynthesis [Arthrobacter bambusae]MDQ0099503.1 glycosyltransferase involved in cell wall biosynthesis [Arthrobacter bambusae]